MPAAIDRILRAMDAGERIVLYGDYDVDGVTSLTILSGLLHAYGANVRMLPADAGRGRLRAERGRRRALRADPAPAVAHRRGLRHGQRAGNRALCRRAAWT